MLRWADSSTKVLLQSWNQGSVFDFSEVVILAAICPREKTSDGEQDTC